MSGLKLFRDEHSPSADDRETEAVVRGLHASLARRRISDVAAESVAQAHRAAALDLAAGLSAYFALETTSSQSPRMSLTDVMAELDAGPSLAPAAAAAVLADVWGASVGYAGRRDRGAIYTPNDVVEWMASEALEARLAEALGFRRARVRAILTGTTSATDVEQRELERTMLNLRVLDPACGAGAFLVGSARVIAGVASRLRAAGLRDLEPLSTPQGALQHCCHGFEIDPESAEIATTVVLLATHLRGDAPSVSGDLVSVRNPLIEGLAHAMAPDGWDLIVMNPPYVGEKHIRTRLGAHVARSLRDAHGFARDLLIHFVLCGLEALRDGGALSAIISDTSFTMESAAELRRLVIDEHRLHSIAWCRPFAGVAVRGGILTVVNGRDIAAGDGVEWIAADNGCGLGFAPRNPVSTDALATLPSRPFFRPTSAATAFVDRWRSVDRLEDLWRAVGARGSRGQMDMYTAHLSEGDWTLLGAVVRSGQGLATGDDRRYVAYVRGTPEAHAAEARVKGVVDTIFSRPDYVMTAEALSGLVADGMDHQEALLELIARDEPLTVPGRKPFRVVEPQDVRHSSLSETEQRGGIASGPHWLPYETSDRSTLRGGARWIRTNGAVIDWSADAVGLLHERRHSGDRRPVLRNQDLWFQGGVTHNRVTSYLRARRLPPGAIFSSESPVYVPLVDWLDEDSLLALLNSSLIEFAVKTFLASRNHIEVGHLRRLPIPVLRAEERMALAGFAVRACATADSGDAQGLKAIEAALDEYVRELYGVNEAVRLEVVR